ncbi:MAG: TonB-dependent receptor [Dysgonomonas sp.]|nr:TonB-dependent receptor [Dysgonomonas sp.]
MQAQSDSIRTQHINEVQVTTSVKPSSTLSTNTVQSLNTSDIQRFGIQSVTDAIRRFTGIVVKDYGGIGGFKAVSIRGNGAEHTSVLYDGFPISNTQTGQIDMGQFSLENVDMLSLVIGQGDDIFRTARSISSIGTINIETRTPVFKDKNYQAQVNLKTGSWGFFSPYIYYAYKLSDKFSMSIDGNWKRSDGQYPFERDNVSITVKSKRKNSDVDMKRTEFNLFGDVGKNQTLAFKAYYFDSERGLPGSVILQGTEILENSNKERLWDKNFFTQAKYINKSNENLHYQIQGKYTHSYTKYIDEDSKYESGKQESRYHQNEYYLTGTLFYQLSDELSLSFAEDFSYNTLRGNYSGFAQPNRYTSLSALSGKYENKKLTIVGGLLATYMTENVKQGNTSEDRKKLSPTLSISFKPFDIHSLRIRASYKNIFRVPTFNDMYYARMGNTTLSPEKTQQYNIGATWSNTFSDTFSYFSLTTDLFHNTIKDKIILYPTSFEPKMKNLGKIRINGISTTINANFDLSDKIQLQLSGNYTYQKAIDITDSSDKNYKEQIPFTPVHSGAFSLSVENPWINFGYSFVANSKSYSDLQNIQIHEMEGYQDHTLSFNKTIQIKDYSIRLQADITNLTNKSYYIIKDYPMPERGYWFSMNIKL